MKKGINEIIKEMKAKLTELRSKRKNVLFKFKKKLEEEKISQVRSSILSE